MSTARVGNAEQAERWNGEGGLQWIANRERHVTAHERLVPHLFRGAAIAPGDRVLDVGCGCGETTVAAARAASGALGLDLSGPMLEVARRLAGAAGAANARFEQGDAQISPLGQSRYDVVISKFGVMFFGDPAAAFANIASGVRSGGRLAFLCWQDDEHNEMFGIPLGAFRACADAPSSMINPLFEDPRQVRALLTGTGWADVRVERVDEPARLGSDVADVMGYIRGMRMVRCLAAEVGDALTEQALASLAEQYAARQRDDGVWIRAGAWLVTARRAPAGPG